MDKRTLNELMAWADMQEQRTYPNDYDYDNSDYNLGRESVLVELRTKIVQMSK